jgi:hypothetical protein
MQPQSEDTHPEIERIQIELFRQASIAKKVALVDAWSQSIRNIARLNIQKEHPNASEEEVKLMLVERMYGKELADKVRKDLEARKQK